MRLVERYERGQLLDEITSLRCCLARCRDVLRAERSARINSTLRTGYPYPQLRDLDGALAAVAEALGERPPDRRPREAS